MNAAAVICSGDMADLCVVRARFEARFMNNYSVVIRVPLWPEIAPGPQL